MKKGITAILPLIMLLSACATPTPQPPTVTPEPSPTPEGERAGWNLVWHDEFSGNSLDLNNWTYDLGANGWGNAELEEYTNQPENARVENGMLVIEAHQDPSLSYTYTSARIKTQGLQAWQYGRIEARMKLPHGQGIWPAFWMLGNDITTAGWPNCGEIDIMEFIGREPDHIYTTLHGPGYAGAQGIGTYSTMPQGSLLNDFHTYAIEWEANEIRWYVDDTQIFGVPADKVPGKWVYDHPFFIILNLAVGGNWPGIPDASTSFPQQMLVDYVRVYQRP